MTFNIVLLLLSSIIFSYSSHAAGTSVVDEPTEVVFRRIEYKFKDPELLKLALTHSSYDMARTGAAVGNERLEFLGDAVLEYGIKLQISNRGSSSLNDVTAQLTENTVLATISDAIELPSLALLPPSFFSRMPYNQTKTKADLVEALIGAIYLDGGVEAIEGFLERFWFSEEAPKNYSTTLFKSDMEDTAEIVRRPDYNPSYLRLLAAARIRAQRLSRKECETREHWGKSILKFVVSEFLYRRFPELPPGDLTIKSQAFIATGNLSALFGDKSLARIGEIYLGRGLKVATQFILWHCTAPAAPEEMKVAVCKPADMLVSDTVIVYPMHIKEEHAKLLLLEILHPLGKTPTFETEEITSSSPSEFTSQVILNTKPISKKTKALSSTKAEKMAVIDALEELFIEAFLNLTKPSLADAKLNSYVRALEALLRALGPTSFNYHQIAEDPFGEGFRIEIQGKGITPTIIGGTKLLLAQGNALRKTIWGFWNKEFLGLKGKLAAERLEFSNALKLFKRILMAKLKQLQYEPEIHLTKSSKEPPVVELDVKLHGPSRIIASSDGKKVINYTLDSTIWRGTGIGIDEAELNAIFEGFRNIQSTYTGVGGSIWSIFDRDIENAIAVSSFWYG